MKTSVIFLFSIILSLQTTANSGNGNLVQLSPGSYRIAYPRINIDIFFDHIPVGVNEDIKVDIYLNENEKFEIANILKQQIDDLPEAFIIKYLNREIYMLQINNNSEYGYNTDKEIIVEVTKIKQGMSYSNSLKSALVHQLAHLIEYSPETRNAAGMLKSYLNNLYQMYYKSDQKTGYSIYEKGFVSRYANGELSGQYSVSDEYAEIFAHLICAENRADLMDFLATNPQNVLGIKVSKVIDFIDEHVSTLRRGFFMGEEVATTYTIPMDLDMEEDGEMLLAAHELRSYESFDFSATDGEERGWDYKEKSTETIEVIEKTVPLLNSYRNSYSQPDPISSETQEETSYNSSNMQPSKKKGGGWIWVAAVIALLVVSN
jgi:hypothetical protein